jgi:hypothetical protein
MPPVGTGSVNTKYIEVWSQDASDRIMSYNAMYSISEVQEFEQSQSIKLRASDAV